MSTDAINATPPPPNEYMSVMPEEFSQEQAVRVRALRQANILLTRGWGRPAKGPELLQVAAWIVDGTLIADDELRTVADLVDEDTEAEGQPPA